MEEDGKLRYCAGECHSETPHKVVMRDDKPVFTCEFCEFTDTVSIGKRVYDLPVFDKKN